MKRLCRQLQNKMVYGSHVFVMDVYNDQTVELQEAMAGFIVFLHQEGFDFSFPLWGPTHFLALLKEEQ